MGPPLKSSPHPISFIAGGIVAEQEVRTTKYTKPLRTTRNKTQDSRLRAIFDSNNSCISWLPVALLLIGTREVLKLA
jgi:hypothetical protein